MARVLTYALTLLLVASALPVLPGSQSGRGGQDYARRRSAMVRDQIVARGVTHRATLQAMRSVERHLFVDPALRSRAYEDNPLPIGYGQTISQPFIVAYMTSLLGLKPEHRVLEIGTGSGYQAAVLAMMADSVYTMEIVKELASTAKKRLQDLGYPNVEVVTGDGYYGLPGKAPFHAIVVTAAAEHIPPPLIEQLCEGGKMVIPVGSQFMVQNLILVEKKKGRITTENLMPVRFVPFTREDSR
ncbi:MAG: protein-L-isoaspartate(D-aspartate) O-methyltransferase [Bacteroidales bacterium]|nr:protein-L-isoaspartate(D-aspartate) O-methyltransferase [Bacteroidales bacterium]MDD3522358.1 protein-L-isoaspartate(D-aspartate) O-methyltransferase [Bacteroidales bacterium]MDD4029805.1 protein-L-isoaspartate(D-aspartate) O-methyltransferase [Bacteroidales bacterium]MDD4434892.1 protein-L-isoaspartate(D-aspartate) O-methyltransferase [Bacteroidales bacterium]MDD5732843.1 protein-L-isoaspartate(D-aspartate) O-methyltransferase [Bacteroidales bacterium]